MWCRFVSKSKCRRRKPSVLWMSCNLDPRDVEPGHPETGAFTSESFRNCAIDSVQVMKYRGCENSGNARADLFEIEKKQSCCESLCSTGTQALHLVVVFCLKNCPPRSMISPKPTNRTCPCFELAAPLLMIQLLLCRQAGHCCCHLSKYDHHYLQVLSQIRDWLRYGMKGREKYPKVPLKSVSFEYAQTCHTRSQVSMTAGPAVLTFELSVSTAVPAGTGKIDICTGTVTQYQPTCTLPDL